MLAMPGRRWVVAGGLAAVAALGGCQSTVSGRATGPAGGVIGAGSATAATPGSASGTGTPNGTPTHRQPRATSGPCRYAETEQTLSNPNARDVGLPPDPDPTPATGTQPVTLTTNRGTVVITLDRAKAPCAVQSFLYLTGKGFFDNTPCPRVSTKANDGLGILQCGDPTGTTAGGPTYQFTEENLATADYRTGAVAMANAGPGTTGSQFFICHQDARGLTRNYSTIGAVTTGLDVIQRVAAAGNDHSNPAGGGRPALPITITSAHASP
jgi:peptidyl-prolyl cis-trans isomerase B (cyclophilin B)